MNKGKTASRYVDPSPGDILWQKRFKDTVWKIICTKVVYPDTIEIDENGLITSLDPFWKVRFESSKGETFETTWSPKNRILFHQFVGWPKQIIGEIKQTLIQHRWNKNAL